MKNNTRKDTAIYTLTVFSRHAGKRSIKLLSMRQVRIVLAALKGLRVFITRERSGKTFTEVVSASYYAGVMSDVLSYTVTKSEELTADTRALIPSRTNILPMTI